jgi:hypothetical protein
MGVTLCEVHETAAFEYVCTHIDDHLSRLVDKRLNKTMPESINAHDPAFESIVITRLPFPKTLKIPSIYWYCDLCSREFKFHGKSFSDTFHLITNSVNIYRFTKQTLVVCVLCLFKEYFRVDPIDFKFIAYGYVDNPRKIEMELFL